MDILEKIIAHKKQEVSLLKSLRPLDMLQRFSLMQRPCISMKRALQDSETGIISEYKRKSPSKGIINDTAEVQETTSGYEKAGASGLSVLTDFHFFGGSTGDLLLIRDLISIPILRKDFMVDEYQLIEAKAIGADVILLIAAALTVQETLQLAKSAHNLGLEVLLELHGEDELGHINDYVNMVGINNRNLKTFEVNIEKSIELASLLPKDMLKVAESGISEPATVINLKKHGFKGFLMGENFMKEHHPEMALKSFIESLK